MQFKSETATTIQKQAEEKKQGLIEQMWETLPAAKLSGATYLNFNENLVKALGRDNPIAKLGLNIEKKEELDWANYKFL